MKEFQSQLEELLPAEELFFDATPGFGRYKPFLEQAIAHPAKMNTRLTEYLLKTLTKEGDIVLDPMSGSGQTGVIAALLGRDAVCVELEEKFYKWQLETKVKLETSQTLSTKGKMSCILGDARKLCEILSSVDAVVTSSPYGNSKKGDEEEDRMANNLEKHGLTEETRRNRHTPGRLRAMKSMVSGYSNSEENIGNLPLGEIDAIITSPPYGEAQEGKGIAVNGYQGDKHSPTDLVGQRSYMPDKFENEGNISKLKHGEIDAVITSPPYAIDPKNVCHTKEGKTLEDYDKKRGFKPTAHQRIAYSTNPENIGHLPLGNVDAVITSPPYSEGLGHGRGKSTELQETKKLHLHGAGSYAENDDNIGEIRAHGEIDAVITSPPYEGQDLVMSGRQQMAERLKNAGYSEKEVKHHLSNAMSQEGNDTRDGYSNSERNIGNLKKETYLEAMLKVYIEMYKVLKANGQAIIVIKPFIRNKKVVDLPYQTWLLMQKCGFKLTKLFKLRLTQQSFWRILYQKKHPEVDVIAHEYILVCQKPLFVVMPH